MLANDTDGDAGDKLITAATQPAHGTVAVAGDGSSLTYKPNPDYCNEPGAEPTDDFTYTITGGSEASVAVTVECSDDNPVAVDDQRPSPRTPTRTRSTCSPTTPTATAAPS